MENIIWKDRPARIAVIAIQGNVMEHVISAEKALKDMGIPAEVIPVKHRGTIHSCDAIILPGGESTTLGRLLAKEGMDDEIKAAAARDKPIMGTCAGLVLLAHDGGEQVRRTGQKLLDIIDISVDRNAFGGQRDSFEAIIDISILDSPYHAVFIRAPVITRAGHEVDVLARFEDRIVGAKQGKIIALAFHPELTEDLRIHYYFFEMLKAG